MQTNNEENFEGEKRQKLLIRLWCLWNNLFDRLPDWIFASEAEPTPLPPGSEDPNYGEALESYKLSSDQRKSFHDETSKTIRGVFYSLVGACVFCIITLAGSPDAQLITSGATVKLPALNYDVEFRAFLVVGPVFLIALTIYLHIFVGQHRLIVIAPESRQPILPNFSSWTARILVVAIFYWMVPITLVVFTWKAWPRPYGPLLGYATLGIAAGLVFLQIRRCPKKWRGWCLPLLAVAFAIFAQQMFSVTTARQLNLFKADLKEQDLRDTNLSDAFLSEANLTGANLSGANLTGVNLSGANLSGADLSDANLSGADLSDANLSGANLIDANLSGANLIVADLSEAVMSGANLSGADLSVADLSEADMSRANLTGANLTDSDLSEARLLRVNLTGANLTDSDLSGAYLPKANLSKAILSDAKIVQAQLEKACGDEWTILPEGLIINPCPKSK